MKALKTDFTLILVSWIAGMKGSKEVCLVKKFSLLIMHTHAHTLALFLHKENHSALIFISNK